MRFLITGSQRSGTTMLASLLARHPDISVFDEDQSYELLVSEKSEGVFKVPRWGDLLPGPTWGDPDQQMSRPFQWRGEPMLHMVRNPLDVVASMDRLTMSGGVPWLDRYGHTPAQMASGERFLFETAGRLGARPRRSRRSLGIWCCVLVGKEPRGDPSPRRG